MPRSAHYNSLQETHQPVAYLPYTQDLADLSQLVFELRTRDRRSPRPLPFDEPCMTPVRASRLERSPHKRRRIDQTIAQERTFANLGTCFAALALLIACVGLYGAMAYTVARRTGEIGIRMALGAQRRGIIWMVLREVLTLAAVGLIAGYVAARFTTHFVESFLVRAQAQRSVGHRRRDRDPAERGAACRLPAGVACVAHRSGIRAAQRVVCWG